MTTKMDVYSTGDIPHIIILLISTNRFRQYHKAKFTNSD